MRKRKTKHSPASLQASSKNPAAVRAAALRLALTNKYSLPCEYLEIDSVWEDIFGVLSFTSFLFFFTYGVILVRCPLYRYVFFVTIHTNMIPF